jgi:hypothetical protein
VTDPGWYADPDDAAMLRWWDGEQWTDHREPAQGTPPGTDADGDVLVHVRTGKDERTDLVATTDRITIRGETFALDDIDAVSYTAVRSHLNGAYQGTSFTLRVRAGERKQDYLMATNHKDERLDEFGEAYGRLVALLDAAVLPRLAADMAARLAAGETITLGPAGARVELVAAGFRLKKPLSKPVPWAQVHGTELEGGRLFFLVERKPGAEPKRHSMVGLEGDNIVVLPHLVGRLRGEAG